jgi:hypothetical protein
MATDRLKFRCYRCNQLLASAANKAGTVVSCPKCQADLVVPAPEPQSGSEPELPVRPMAEPQLAKIETGVAPRAQSDDPYIGNLASSRTATVEQAARPEPDRSFVNDISAMIPPDLADLRPEDLRVEAEFFQSLTREPARPPAPDPAPWPAPESPSPSFGFETPIFTSPAPVVSEPVRATRTVEEAPALPRTVDLAPRPPEIPKPTPEVPTIGPQIEIEPPTILPPSHELGRVREVVLPASVVLAWSLFVLLGITLSFVAGLLMGHFLWK